MFIFLCVFSAIYLDIFYDYQGYCLFKKITLSHTWPTRPFLILDLT